MITISISAPVRIGIDIISFILLIDIRTLNKF